MRTHLKKRVRRTKKKKRKTKKKKWKVERKNERKKDRKKEKKRETPCFALLETSAHDFPFLTIIEDCHLFAFNFSLAQNGMK